MTVWNGDAAEDERAAFDEAVRVVSKSDSDVHGVKLGKKNGVWTALFILEHE